MPPTNTVWCDSWENLVSEIDDGLEIVLEKAVAPVVADMLRKQIKSDIYDAYTPKNGGWVDTSSKPWKRGVTYTRRNSLLGEYEYLFENRNELTVTSTAEPATSIGKTKFVAEQPGAFLEMLESDNMSDSLWKGGFPRPAVSNLQETIDTYLQGSHNRLTGAINRGIRLYIES